MSNWTHISGSVRLHGSPLVEINNRTEFLQPDNQMKIKLAKNIVNAPTKYEVTISSLPVIKQTVTEAIKLLPTGEQDLIDYNIYQSKRMYGISASNFMCDAEADQFIKLVHEYMDKNLYLNHDNCCKLVRWVKYLSFATLTILDDVRWCGAVTMMKCMISFLTNLYVNNIRFGQGYFEWEDYDNNNVYAIKISSDQLACMILDANTRNVVSKKLYDLTYDQDDITPVVKEKLEDPNWSDLMLIK